MNRLNWSQKEPYIEYHVLEWKTSHLHPRISVKAGAGFEMKGSPQSMGRTNELQSAQQEGIGWVRTDRSGSGKWRAGILGQDGTAQDGAREVARDKDGVSLSSQQPGREHLPQEAMAAQQTVPAAAHGIIYSSAFKAGYAMRKIGGRIQETMVRLRHAWLKQQKKPAVQPKNNNGYEKARKDKHGTRQIDKEEVLAMQSENHYLLDSYDRNGQYSVLGK